jgi:hypothetical protein
MLAHVLPAGTKAGIRLGDDARAWRRQKKAAAKAGARLDNLSYVLVFEDRRAKLRELAEPTA